MSSIVFDQFKDDLPVDENKEYYISPNIKDKGLQEIHKLCLFPEKLREYLQAELGDNLKQTDISKYINTTTTLKWTPLMIASRNGVTESVKLLLEHGADINLQDKDGITALMLACFYCNTTSNIDCVKLLLEHSLAVGADINLQDEDGYTALMIACEFCNTYSSIQCVKLLLNHSSPQAKLGSSALVGADINLQDEDGYTALMLACEFCNTTSNIQCVKLLLEHYELTSQELDIKPLIEKDLLIKELYPIFLPYILKTGNKNILKLLPVDLLVEIININFNTITQSNKLKEFDLNSIILYEMKKCL